MLSKLHSVKLIDDVPLQKMPVLHSDEEVSKDNELGPFLNDGICITQQFTYQINLDLEPKSTLLSESVFLFI